jgi:hypothetical protein
VDGLADSSHYPSPAHGSLICYSLRKIEDLHLLTKKQYEHLRDIVDVMRDAMFKILSIKKMYLMNGGEMIKH